VTSQIFVFFPEEEKVGVKKIKARAGRCEAPQGKCVRVR
jgi:hypothetical protein